MLRKKVEQFVMITSNNSRKIRYAVVGLGMIAYRLQFEAANLQAIESRKSGQIGGSHIFNSVFTQQMKPRDIRLQKATGECKDTF